MSDVNPLVNAFQPDLSLGRFGVVHFLLKPDITNLIR